MSDRLDLAIWLESQELSKGGQHDNESSQTFEQPGIQVHLNFWKLPDCNALDIGIVFPVLKDGKLNIFINTQNEIEVNDITQLLKRDIVINTIFNEFIKMTSCPKENSCITAERKSENSSDIFCLYCVANPIHLEKKFGGTVITFSIKNICNNECGCLSRYIRLRLTGDGIDKLYIKDKIPFSKIEYYTSKREFLDFRLNNARSLPISLLEYRKNYPTLNKVRCFLMIESGDDLSLYNKNYKKVRAIEKENWSTYFEGVNPYIQSKESIFDIFTSKGRKKNKAILAYQWNVEEPGPDFSLFAEIKHSEISIRTGIFFLVVSSILELVPSCGGDLIKYVRESLFK